MSSAALRSSSPWGRGPRSLGHPRTRENRMLRFAVAMATLPCSPPSSWRHSSSWKLREKPKGFLRQEVVESWCCAIRKWCIPEELPHVASQQSMSAPPCPINLLLFWNTIVHGAEQFPGKSRQFTSVSPQAPQSMELSLKNIGTERISYIYIHIYLHGACSKLMIFDVQVHQSRPMTNERIIKNHSSPAWLSVCSGLPHLEVHRTL